MFSCFKKSEKIFTARGLFISAVSHVKLITETRVYVCQKNMKSMSIFLNSFSKVFAEKHIKKYSTRNEEWIESETALMQSDCVLSRAIMVPLWLLVLHNRIS